MRTYVYKGHEFYKRELSNQWRYRNKNDDYCYLVPIDISKVIDFLSQVDMEGISGICRKSQVEEEMRDYQKANII